MASSLVPCDSDPTNTAHVRSFPKMGFKERAATEFCVKLGKSFSETYQMLICAYGEEHLSTAEVKKWYKRFKNGEMLDDDEESSRKCLESVFTKVGSQKESGPIKTYPQLTEDPNFPSHTNISMQNQEEYENSSSETSTDLHQTTSCQEDIRYSAAGSSTVKFNFRHNTTAKKTQNSTLEMKDNIPIVVLESESESSDDVELLSNNDQISRRAEDIANSKSYDKGRQAQVKCHICFRVYKNSDILRAHLKIHTETHKCRLCGANFVNSYKLKQHEISHSGLKPFACSICQKDFGYEHNLKRHMWMVHNQANNTSQTSNSKQQFQCTICNWTLRDFSELNRHMLGHAKAKPIVHPKCKICDKTFTRSSELNRHLRTHLPTKSHQCNFCGKFFGELFDLKRHKQTHELEPIDASTPETVYTESPPHDSNIIVKMEPQETVYPDVVSYTANGDKDLETIESTVEDMVENIEYIQETVPIKMEPHVTTASTLVHVQGGSYEETKEEFIVSTTANQNGNSQYLERGKNDKNESHRTKAIKKGDSTANTKTCYHRCHVCFKLYKRRDVLMRHMNLHTGCFQCDRCNLTFSSVSHLDTHMKRHMGIKPHKCTYCEKAFTTAGELRTHTKRHLGVKEHKCNICPKKFFVAHSLRLHMRKHLAE